jgi:glycosyltransferase involved in cell wall biosynthesis
MYQKSKIQENNNISYAVVVPCYNEEKRFPYDNFLSFAIKNPEVLLCFVNDGSKDCTLEVLKKIERACPQNIKVYDMPQNGGKAEAVRNGMLYVNEICNATYIGFLDADLATSAEEWLKMANYANENKTFGAVVGSRIQRLGANIVRDDNRSIFSSIIKKFIKIILKTNFQDTQCGAKIFNASIVQSLFSEQFITPWLFDVEIFLRLQNKFGKSSLPKGVLEYPLQNWTEVGDSKLKLKDTIKIPMQLLKLHFKYNISKIFITKSGYSIFDTSNTMPKTSKEVNHFASILF